MANFHTLFLDCVTKPPKWRPVSMDKHKLIVSLPFAKQSFLLPWGSGLLKMLIGKGEILYMQPLNLEGSKIMPSVEE